MMKVLVTGATGFIGGRIFEELEVAGLDVVGTCRNSSEPGRNMVALDVSDHYAVDRLFADQPFDAVIHCAGIAHRFGKIPDRVYREVNVEGTKNMALAARRAGVKKFVLVSSVLVYGGGGTAAEPRKETDRKLPRDAYAQSKLDSETAAIEAFGASKVSLCIFRPAPVIGEGSKGNFARLVKAIDRGRFVWLGRGENRKSLTYVGDIAAACRSFLTESGTDRAQILNIASPPGSMAEIVSAISGELGRKIPRIHIPESFARFVSVGGKLLGGPFGRIGRSLETWFSEDVYSTTALAKAFTHLDPMPLVEAIKLDVRARIDQK